ncbi:ParB N-terminal domain-containing protein [Nonomuraea sp. NPDC049480]|uniref:ParB N-terminal domain-containing protein n=1 Tax=Nonomuraea sp. NPDC049480 TaxID=3364353 RepID=UPI002E63CCF1|nr:ParB N-terminal domain-containing protein [Nonomuraea sp.]
MNTEAPQSPNGYGPQANAVDCSRIETFQMLAWKWNVTAAKQLTAGREPTGELDPGDWAGMLYLVRVDHAHAAATDLSEPVIAVPIPEAGWLIIDGWHRIHKALTTEVDKLPVIVLTAEEELACRVHGGEKGQGWR